MSRYVVGVNGGTTKTVALVADGSGRVLGAARGPGSNWTGADVELPMTVVVAAVREAQQQAGVRHEDVAVAVCGLAGADWPEDHVRRQEFLAGSNLAERVLVKNDAFVGLRAGTRRRYGAVNVAGTGTNTAVIATDGREWAFGYYASYGGAGAITEDAVWAVLRAEDGRGEPTALTGLVLARLGFATPDDLLRALILDQVPQVRILSLCPLVFEAADSGDQVAAEVIVKHGLVLGEYAATAIRRFGMESLELDLVLSGSIFKGQGPLLVDTIGWRVHKVAPRARLARAELEPAVGGVLLALDTLGREVTGDMYESLSRTVPGPGFFATADGKGVRPISHGR